jgi:hypothetical protein
MICLALRRSNVVHSSYVLPPFFLVLGSYRQQHGERVLVVWADDPDSIIPLVQDFENKLIKLVWYPTSPSASYPTAQQEQPHP